MSHDGKKRIGLIVGREVDWPTAFMSGVQKRDKNVTVELVKLSGTSMDALCSYDVIIDRVSHEIPYYRTYLKHASVRGAYIINDPFVWSNDSRFLGTSIVYRLGLKAPKTIVLPKKEVEIDSVPDSFRNLEYPMDWEGIIQQVGVPAILKEVESGGRRISTHVSSVDELIQRYDESGTRNMMLQERISGGQDIHCYVIGQDRVRPLFFQRQDSRYIDAPIDPNSDLYKNLVESAKALTEAYGYDVNLVEFKLTESDLYVINCTNPAPIISRDMLPKSHFDWIVEQTVDVAISRAYEPLPQRVKFKLDKVE